jgi:cytochrome c peroxidase
MRIRLEGIARRVAAGAVAIVVGLVLSQSRVAHAAPGGAASGGASSTGPLAPPAVSTAFYASPFARRPNAAELTELGRALFSDAALSASGKLACASCHDPAHRYAPPNRRSVQLGGPDMARPGLRAAPTLTYEQATPPFSEHFNDTDGDDSIDQGPTGGRGWDGRAGSAHEQAALPLLSPLEMANDDRAAVVARLRRSPNAARLAAAFGPSVLDDEALAWNGLLWALEVFQQSPADFSPFDSKYDAWLRRQTELSEAEQRGLALFNDAAKGNCARCHPSALKRGVFPSFTDHGLAAIGVPRNAAIAANANRGFFDLGLCGPLRTDLSARAEYCGLFKTPSLRNVALRGAFFHNGVFHRLEDVVRFYARRDTNPGEFYARDGHGRINAFDDLPQRYRANLDREAPFGGQRGGRPALTDAEIADIVAFLKTLTDGYGPKAGLRPATASR